MIRKNSSKKSENKNSEKSIRVITFGTFDLFHIGHLNMLRKAKSLGTYLAVGVSSDELNKQKKGRTPISSLKSRMSILKELRCVDEVFIEYSLEDKSKYCKNFDIFVIGDDWKSKFDHIKTETLKVIYLPRTPSISTTKIIEIIQGTSPVL